MLSLLAAAALLFQTQTAPVLTNPAPHDQDGPIATASDAAVAETPAQLRMREALAYSNPMPRGAPDRDYPLVAWCDALVSGHVKLGETLTDRNPEDLEIIRLGKLEAADFRGALAAARPRESAATRAAADAAAAEASGRWTAVLAQTDEAARSQAFGLFFGLPGRCEHAARRIRENITTPPATLKDVGLESVGEDQAQ
ncbi:hypothetical protein [Brevundimonas goettingensis]|uniref:Uncharacterized protein n=1 Tax=Brevundimonas goettingensis TaxID=2774190 RepID=A0A975C4F3_9CAUL|nr:hypothetical protein [Brevundimonas goettingensis]QTC91695.1 hypothetical protein IFJ75_01795 [Brevundimonas goettingensis]